MLITTIQVSCLIWWWHIKAKDKDYTENVKKKLCGGLL